MKTLVLLRPAENIFNASNKFVGWSDVPLSLQGVRQTRTLAKKLKEDNFVFDRVYSSYLMRAEQTLDFLKKEIVLPEEINRNWELNERHLGVLEGLNIKEIVNKVGLSQVFNWTKTLAYRPPLLNKDDARYPGLDPNYLELEAKDLPLSESFTEVIERVRALWLNSIKPQLRQKDRILVIAHENSLKALISFIQPVNSSRLINIRIPKNTPIVYNFDNKTNYWTHLYLYPNKGSDFCFKRAA